MAKYIVLERSYINNELVEPGAEVEFSGTHDPKIDTNLEHISGDYERRDGSWHRDNTE